MFQESPSSTFWFQPVWDLRAGGQHAVNFFHLVGVLVSIKQLKDMTQDFIYSHWGRIKGSWFCFMAELVWYCLVWLFSFVSAFFSLLWLNLLFGTLERPRRLKLFTDKRQGTWGCLCLGRPYRVLLGFKPNSTQYWRCNSGQHNNYKFVVCETD